MGSLALMAGCAGPTSPNAPEAARRSSAAAVDPVSSTRPASPAGIQQITLGHSVENRPIVAHLFGDPSVGTANSVLIFGGIHGNEPTSAGVCKELVAHLQANPETWRGRCVAVVPEANPDGLARRLRTNKNLVDLNRNFPAANWKVTRQRWNYGGAEPLSQPESKLLVNAVEQFQPARIVSVHSMDDPCNNFDGPGQPLAELMARHNGYPVKASIGYPTPGSFGSWAGGDKRIPVITLELPNRGTTATSWEKNRAALLAFIKG